MAVIPALEEDFDEHQRLVLMAWALLSLHGMVLCQALGDPSEQAKPSPDPEGPQSSVQGGAGEGTVKLLGRIRKFSRGHIEARGGGCFLEMAQNFPGDGETHFSSRV